MANVLYIHGMGGGGDSRIPWLLRCAISEQAAADKSMAESVDIVVRTYDFDPEVATRQIEAWVEELQPSLIIGESLGSIHALRIKGIPHILISPSLNAPRYFGCLSPLALIPGITALFDRIYRPKPGDRQVLHFTFRTLKKYTSHLKEALKNSPRQGSKDVFYAFFGTRDHYRRSGIVSIRTWKKYFGNTFTLYDGTHFMEDEYIYSLVLPKIYELLGL